MPDLEETPTTDVETFNKEQTRKIARDSFLLGVDWALRTIVSCDIWEFDSTDARLLRKRAEKVIGNYVPE